MSNYRNFSACKTIRVVVVGGRDSIKKMEGKQSFEQVSLLTAGINVTQTCVRLSSVCQNKLASSVDAIAFSEDITD